MEGGGVASVIKILSDQESKKIAAGEVVERPASVVKELFENSIDAKSSKISLHIEKAGKKLIRVVDNGCGMSPDDAQICFANHATSKIKKLDDLNEIKTFGFRGEALATISSVSKVLLKTRYNDEDFEEELGVAISYVDGAVVSSQSVACSPGTDIFISDLFYNTPVRQKFLKQDETEWNQIQSLVHAFALSNLDIHFQLYKDKKNVLNAPPVKTVRDRVLQIWGYNLASQLIDLQKDDESSALEIHGLVSHYNFWQYGRQKMFFFVNGRWVKNTELSKGVMKGYRNVLPPARFPAVFLFITLKNSLVDINVHPRKEEVRFVKPTTVKNKIQNLVTKTLEKSVDNQLGGGEEESLTRPFSGFDQKVAEQTPLRNSTPDEKFFSVTLNRALQDYAKNENCDVHIDQNVTANQGVNLSIEDRDQELPSSVGLFEEAQDLQSAVVEKRDREVPSEHTRIVGQILNTYIVVENKDGLLLVDQHAAHERILYEKFLKNFEKKDGTRLLFPEIIKLSESRQKIVLEEKEFLLNQGIEIEQIGQTEIAIKTSPPKIESKSLRELIFEMIEFVEQNETLDHEDFRKKLNEHMHSQMACKMAVKAGEMLPVETMKNIINQLQEVDNRFICVHGRPTTWSISKFELEKKFRRRV